MWFLFFCYVLFISIIHTCIKRRGHLLPIFRNICSTSNSQLLEELVRVIVSGILAIYLVRQVLNLQFTFRESKASSKLYITEQSSQAPWRSWCECLRKWAVHTPNPRNQGRRAHSGTPKERFDFRSVSGSWGPSQQPPAGFWCLSVGQWNPLASSKRVLSMALKPWPVN